MKPHFPSLCASLLALSLAASPAARATISLTLAGYTNDFAVDTTAGDWITGFGIAGDEKVLQPKDFLWAFDCAREAGLRIIAHAGEWGGPQSIRDTLELVPALKEKTIRMMMGA